jgi:hypothetical protein
MFVGYKLNQGFLLPDEPVCGYLQGYYRRLLTGWSLVRIRPGEPLPNSTVDLSRFFRFFPNLVCGFTVFPFSSFRGRFREPLAIRRRGIALYFFQADVACCNPMRRVSNLGQSHGLCLAQPVKKAINNRPQI